MGRDERPGEARRAGPAGRPEAGDARPSSPQSARTGSRPPRESGSPTTSGRPTDRAPRRDAGAPGTGRADGRGRPASGRPASGAAAARPGASREEIGQRTYDPRREERRRATRVALPDDVDPRDLDADARRELRTLSKETADLVARHLVVTGRLLDDEPEQALAHARAARALAGRVGVVREAVGLTAYAAGEWAEALSELRAARRITGRPEHLGVFADCERALGRPERALAYADDPQLAQMSQDQRVELVIVLAGARRDLGQLDAAVLALQDVARRTSDRHPWAARLWYAYADALLEAGREAEARGWFERAAAADVDGETDAGDRLLALDGVVLDGFDVETGDSAQLPTEDELADLAAAVATSDQERLASQAQPAGPQPEEGPEAGAPATDPAGAAAQDVEPRPAEAVPQHNASGVAAPVFVAPPQATGDNPDDLRLFD